MSTDRGRDGRCAARPHSRVLVPEKEGHCDTCDHVGEPVEVAPVSPDAPPGAMLSMLTLTSGRHSRGPSTWQ